MIIFVRIYLWAIAYIFPRSSRIESYLAIERQPNNRPTRIYFTDTPKSNNDSAKTSTSDNTEKVHPTNRDTEYTGDKSKAWTFLESLADSYTNNRIYFVTGFVMAIFTIYMVIINDPYDRHGVNKFMDDHAPKSRDVDLPMGYERTIARERKEKPELYEA